ncbi:MAG: DUF349 domain-containing protein [Microscillaceae bacterium]|nr:DUF349 domain-containing protein [Microscillaceae bacterium]
MINENEEAAYNQIDSEYAPMGDTNKDEHQNEQIVDSLAEPSFEEINIPETVQDEDMIPSTSSEESSYSPEVHTPETDQDVIPSTSLAETPTFQNEETSEELTTVEDFPASEEPAVVLSSETEVQTSMHEEDSTTDLLEDISADHQKEEKEPNLSPEVELTDPHTSQEIVVLEEEDSEIDDYANYNKEDYLALIQKLSEEPDYRKFAPILKEIKPLFDELVNHEKQQARLKYLEDGGEEEGFEFKEDQTTIHFYKLYNDIQKDRTAQIAKVEAEKENNHKRKNDILEKIRALTESEESQASIEELKKLQDEWKLIGPVPGQHNRNLWASYNALIDLFYDKRSIYFELKELDRKKNLATKLSLCEKAEKLVEYESIKQAIKELNELHEEFKHVGPVPKEEQDALWQRFKAASDRVYDKKRDFIKQREDEKSENYTKKLELCDQIAPFTEFQSDKMTEWNAKTKEILQIQKDWEAIRFIPRDKIKDLSKQFWTPFKAFFNNKNAFIKTLDEEREANLQLKVALCEEADQLVNHSQEDGRTIADKLKDLQRKWKEIGPVPSKHRQSIYDRFKKTCDSFFERRRERYASQEKTYEDNLNLKETVCQKIDAYTLAEGENPEEVLEAFLEEWKNVGFVPKKDKRDIQKKFEDSLYAFIERLNLNLNDQEKLNLNIEINLSKESPFANKKLKQKESAIRRKITKLETDIDVLKNNIGFLANSKKADKLKESLEDQIKDTQKKLDVLKAQLNALKDI